MKHYCAVMMKHHGMQAKEDFRQSLTQDFSAVCSLKQVSWKCQSPCQQICNIARIPVQQLTR